MFGKQIKQFMGSKNLKNIMIIFVVCIISLVPFFLREYYTGHDTLYHASNIVNLTENLKDSFLFPANIVSNIANNFGYGTRLFYPPLAHTLTAYINYFVNDVVISLKIFHLIALLVSGITMYILSKKISNNGKIALLSAIIYMLFPYHLSNTYIRDALAEQALFMFLPLIILGIYYLYHNDIKKFYIYFIIGYVLGMLSHLTMMVYFTVLILIFMVANIKKTLKYIKPLIISSLFILLITSPFLTTLLEHKFLGNYTVFVEGVMSQKIWWSGLDFFHYFNFFKHYNGIKFYIDLTCLGLLLFTFKNYKKIRNKIYDYLIIFLSISFVVSSILFPWDIFPQSFRIIQFAWRFTMFVVFFCSLVAPLGINLLNEKRQKVITFFAIVGMLVMTIFNFNMFSFNKGILKESEINHDFGMGWQKEYLPYNTNLNFDYYSSRSHEIIIKEGNGEAIVLNDDISYLKFNIAGDVTVELPRIYYLNYKLTRDGQIYKFYENDKGFIKTKLSSGTYELTYQKTKLEKTFTIISFLSIIGLGLYIKKSNNLVIEER